MKEIFTAKSIEEAKQAASEQFGVSVDQIVFRILEEPKKSLFGKVKKDAQVEAVYEPLEESVAPKQKAAAPSAEPTEKPFTPAEPEKQAEKPEPAKTPDPTEPGMESEPIMAVLTEAEMTPNLLQARQYIVDIYQHLGVSVSIETMKTENGIRMELTSENKSGTIIGRRGETLDSIQYLASILVNRGQEEYSRLLLDSNGYREKRKDTLENLAEKIARNVLRSGRSTTLEPMNPYERRIIHSKIAEIEGVSSRSVGEDPHRKVVISSNNARRGGNRNYRGGQYQNRGNRRPYRERQPEEYQRSNLDSMKTSFERDYKKPKPEDDLNAGLYGKIEL